ncbi:uncharacterized protein [Nothobranchius furzeri]|uniref:uncharacterized protein isoform X3 n=1 Tax=Nothobranchius furzeri TaxID=105023 RepID=UPI003904C49F
MFIGSFIYLTFWFVLRCCKRASHRKVSRTIRTGSLFEKSKSSLFSWMKFIYRFSQGLRQIDMIDDDVAGSSKTLSAMAKRIRQVCISAMERHGYARGRFGNAWKRKKWVFGLMGVKDKRRRLVLKLVEKRTRRHLVPLIRQHVKSGSAIISDEWRAYKNVLTNMGYKHYTVNHSRWFADPHSGSHTQHIERAWMTIKGHIRRLRGNRTEMLLEEHLKVLEWSSWLGSKHPDGPLGRLFKDIWKSFPV